MRNYLFFIKNFITFLFPPRCAGCQQVGTWLCSICLDTLPRSLERRVENNFPVYDYNNKVVKKSLWLLKFKGIQDLAQIFGQSLYELAIEDLADLNTFSQARGKILVIPVPLSRQRLRQRGFNQAELIARHFVEQDPKNFELVGQLVLKIKNTNSQVLVKKRADRLKNLRGAFLVLNKKKVKDKTVLIIDDVMTTGATINELSRVLNRAGAKQVYGLVVAHG